MKAWPPGFLKINSGIDIMTKFLRSSKFVEYSAGTIVTQYAILFVSLVSSIITARLLGPAGLGQLTLLLLIPWFATVFGRMGVGHSVNYHFGKLSPAKIIVNSLILSGVLGILCMAATFLVAYFFKGTLLKDVNWNLIIFSIFFIPFYILSDHLAGLLQGLYKLHLRNIIYFFQAVINLVMMAFFVILMKWGVSGAVGASMFSLVFLAFALAVPVMKEIKGKELKVDLNIMKQIFGYGLKSHVGNITKDLSYRINIPIINYYLMPISVGYYTIAVQLAEVIWKIPESISSVLLPKIVQMKKEQAYLFTPLIMRTLFVPLLACCLAVLVFGQALIVLIYGKEFLPSASLIVFLLPGILSLSFWKIIISDLIAQGHAEKYSATSVLSLATMVILNLLLIPVMGIQGAAIALSLSYIATTGLALIFYARLTKNSFKNLLLPTAADVDIYKKLLGVGSPRT